MYHIHNINRQIWQKPQLGNSAHQRLSTPCLVLALLTSVLFSLSAAVLAQDKAEKAPARLAVRLGLKAGDLTVKDSPEPYRANPVADEAVDGGVVGGKGRATNSSRSTSGVHDLVGTFSVQNFNDPAAALNHTHASADGFRNFLAQWYRPNFAYKDSAVSAWAYRDIAGGDNYDLWTAGGTDFGIDSVLIAWHSGHGNMSNNVFNASMGANWGERGWDVFSNQMFLGGNNYSYGDERLRYLFWDTCFGVRVGGGNNPATTWGTRSKGLRMVFGYETMSNDNPNYGRYFWEEFAKNKSLSIAFLDASWRINTGQSPAVVAFGATEGEARERLYNERSFYWAAVSNSVGLTTLYNARSVVIPDSASAATDSLSDQEGRVRKMVAKGNSDNEMTEVARSLGIKLDDPGQIQSRPFGLRVVETKGASLVIEPNGNFELIIKKAESQKTSEAVISDEELISRAQEVAGQLNSVSGQTLRVGLMRDLNEVVSYESFQSEPRVVEKTVVFDQMIAGLPFVDPEAGHLEITFDARTGQATRVRSTIQALDLSVSDEQAAVQITRLSAVQAREQALNSFAKPGLRQSLEVVPGSEAVGYQLIDGKAVPVYRALIRNSNFTAGRPQQAIIPLLKVE